MVILNVGLLTTFTAVIVGPLTPFPERVYRRRLSKAERCEVRQLGKSTFEVSDYDQKFILDYSMKNCSCEKLAQIGHSISSCDSDGS